MTVLLIVFGLVMIACGLFYLWATVRFPGRGDPGVARVHGAFLIAIGATAIAAYVFGDDWAWFAVAIAVLFLLDRTVVRTWARRLVRDEGAD